MYACVENGGLVSRRRLVRVGGRRVGAGRIARPHRSAARRAAVRSAAALTRTAQSLSPSATSSSGATANAVFRQRRRAIDAAGHVCRVALARTDTRPAAPGPAAGFSSPMPLAAGGADDRIVRLQLIEQDVADRPARAASRATSAPRRNHALIAVGQHRMSRGSALPRQRAEQRGERRAHASSRDRDPGPTEP